MSVIKQLNSTQQSMSLLKLKERVPLYTNLLVYILYEARERSGKMNKYLYFLFFIIYHGKMRLGIELGKILVYFMCFYLICLNKNVFVNIYMYVFFILFVMLECVLFLKLK